MALPDFAVETDEDVIAAVRDKASYDDVVDEWPEPQARGNLDDAKRDMYTRTGSDEWYSEVPYGQALVALTAMKAKEAVENINIDSYGIADEQLSFSDADPDSSQQIQSWSNEVNRGLKNSSVQFENEQDLSFSNTSSYIG